jgi:DNA polymerase-1
VSAAAAPCLNAPVPVSSRPSPRIAYCVDASEALRLINEVLADAGAGLIAIDIETASTKTEVDRLSALRAEDAVVMGRLSAANKTHASAKVVAALKTEAKSLKAQIAYAERASLDPHRSRARLLQIYGGGQRVAVIDLDRVGDRVLQRLRGKRLVAHNAAFELSFLEKAGVEPGEIHCTLQACRLTHGEHATSLADAAKEYLDVELDKAPQRSDWGATHLTRDQLGYAARDAVVTWRLSRKVLRALGDQALAYEIQMAAIPAAIRMELRGFRLDVDAHARLMNDLAEERIAACEAYARSCVESGHGDFAKAPVPSTPRENIAVLKAFLTSDELERWKRTKKAGTLSTRRSDLLRAAHYPPIAALAKLSSIDKLLTMFGPTFAVFVSPVTGRIHARYRVAGTATGRASCSGPNLQQVPRDPRFRALFKPDPGNVLIVADYASMELRAAAHISGDAVMTTAFKEGQDLHRITAAQIVGKALEEVTAEERCAAKAVNFGACYGLGAKGLVTSAWEGYGIIIDEREAAQRLRAFETAYPRFARWRREHAARCEEKRRIVIGREAAKGIGRFYPKSRLPDGASFYTRACNMPVQGACADASMMALAGIDRALFEEGIEGGPVAWMHDEIVLEVPVEDAPRAAELLAQEMISAFRQIFPGAPVRGLVDPHIGLNWSEAKK